MEMNNTTSGILNETDASELPEPAPWWAMLLIGTLTLITVFTNILVIASFIAEPRLRVPFNYFLLNLAITDTLVGAICMPHYAIYTYYNYWPLSYAQCSFFLFIDSVATSESLLGILVLSLDRLWAVSFPLSYRQHNSPRKFLFAILTTWTISIVVILPSYIRARSDYVASSDPFLCDWPAMDKLPAWASYFYANIFLQWVPVASILICYTITTGRMVHMISIRHQMVNVNADTSPAARQRKQQENQAFIVLTLLSTAVFTLWTPFIVCSIQLFYYQISNDLFYVISYWIGYSMSGVNPFIFNAASVEMRKTLKRLLTCNIISKKKPAEAAAPQ